MEAHPAVLYALFLAIYFHTWYTSLQLSLNQAQDLDGKEEYTGMANLPNIMVLQIARSVLVAALVAGLLLAMQEVMGVMCAYRVPFAAAETVTAVTVTMPGLDAATFPKQSFAGLNVLFHDFVCVLLVYRLNFLFTKFYVQHLMGPKIKLRDREHVRAHLLTIYACNLFLFAGSFTAARTLMRKMAAQAAHRP